MFRELASSEWKTILHDIDREQHFLYYSYLTFRKQHTVHYGQFSEEGELIGVLAYLRGLPFYAFSVYPIQPSFDLKSLLAYAKEQLQLPDDAIGSFIVNEAEMKSLASQLAFIQTPKQLLLMKHVDAEALPPMDKQVLHLGPPYYKKIESKMAELNTMAFSREELHYPFYGVVEQSDLIAVGGYHVYSQDYVELGNIGTDAAWRRRGLGKKISVELTRRGRSLASDVYLNVLEENEGAIRLYQSIGYEVICRQYIAEFLIQKV